jgi:AcrR family transcriptional regulator
MPLYIMSSDAPETRQRILKSTLSLLETGKGAVIRMTDIAKRAGITRQALYLHFSTRAELLIAVTLYVEEKFGSEAALAPSRNAKTGVERLDAYINAWANFLPEIHGIAKALIAMSETDDAAAIAWTSRMKAMRHGCEAAINALGRDKRLSPLHTREQATDTLWTMLSVQNWEQLVHECGWTPEEYGQRMKALARRLFVTDEPSR